MDTAIVTNLSCTQCGASITRIPKTRIFMCDFCGASMCYVGELDKTETLPDPVWTESVVCMQVTDPDGMLWIPAQDPQTTTLTYTNPNKKALHTVVLICAIVFCIGVCMCSFLAMLGITSPSETALPMPVMDQWVCPISLLFCDFMIE